MTILELKVCGRKALVRLICPDSVPDGRMDAQART